MNSIIQLLNFNNAGDVARYLTAEEVYNMGQVLPVVSDMLIANRTCQVDCQDAILPFKVVDWYRHLNVPVKLHCQETIHYREYRRTENGLLQSLGDKPAIKSSFWEAWYDRGLEHRDGDNKPSMISNNWILYHKYGLLHRLRGPAKVNKRNGNKEWRRNGRLHRKRLPAKVGITCNWYYVNGQLHRGGNLPAHDGYTVKKHYKHGKLHRLNGPAVVYRNGKCMWYTNGILIKTRFLKHVTKYADF